LTTVLQTGDQIFRRDNNKIFPR